MTGGSTQPDHQRPRLHSSSKATTIALLFGFVAASSLALPWYQISGKDRSSIDLITSASTLDVIEGATKLLVLGGWLLIPCLVAIAMLVAASGRHRWANMLLLPVSLVVLPLILVGVWFDDVTLAWGAAIAVGSTIASTSFAASTLRRQQSQPA